jgi:DNA polymerase III delta subunit
LDGETCERIDGELRKLAAHGGALDADMLDRLLPPPLDERIYTLVDACLAGDGERVFASAAALLEQGQPAPKLLFSLAAQLRTIAQVAGDPQAARQLGLNPYVLRKAAEQARHMSPEAWAHASRAVWEAEFAWKTGRWLENTALDNALAGVLAAARGVAGTAPPAGEPLGW